MAYIPLFHEIYSDIFQYLCKIINRLYQGERLTKQEIIAGLPQIDWSNIDDYHELLNCLFLFDENEQAQLFIPAPIDIPPSLSELQWLSSIIHEPAARNLMSANLTEKLKDVLKNVKTPGFNNFSILYATGDRNDQITHSLATIWSALTNHKQLIYTNTDAQGILHQGQCSPCRLEYDAATNKYRLIAWLAKEKRAIKMNLDRLSNLVIATTDIPDDCQRKLKNFLISKQKTITLQVTPKYNAVERTFKLFGAYDKAAIYDEQSDTYTLNITYYEFDQQEIIRDILSLGSAATVLAPANIQATIRDILLRTRNNTCAQSTS